MNHTQVIKTAAREEFVVQAKGTSGRCIVKIKVEIENFVSIR